MSALDSLKSKIGKTVIKVDNAIGRAHNWKPPLGAALLSAGVLTVATIIANPIAEQDRRTARDRLTMFDQGRYAAVETLGRKVERAEITADPTLMAIIRDQVQTGNARLILPAKTPAGP